MGLGEKKFTSIEGLLENMGAIQCQDLQAGKWALGIRIRNSTLEKINQLLTTENIVRTHVLRPTYHYVRKEDIRWMLELTSGRIRKTMANQYKRREVTEALCMKTRTSLQTLLEGKKELTYSEIKEQLAIEKKIPLTGPQLQLVLLDAELNQLICNGSEKADKQTYALFDEKIPLKNTLSRQEAVEELTKRFFIGHGPATIQDCARWTGLPIGDIKKGVKGIQEGKEEKIQEKEGLITINDLIDKKTAQTNHLLPRYDEYINGYKDKTAFLPNYENKKAMELGYNAILDEGKIIGKWTRKITTKNVTITYEYFKHSSDTLKSAITEKAMNYAEFLHKELNQND